MAEENTQTVDTTAVSDDANASDAGKTEHTSKYTEKEKAEFSLKKNAERVRELGGDPNELLGLKLPQVDEGLADDAPLTVGTYRQIQRQDAQKTALQLADDIEDEDERAEVKTILKDSFVPSGNPQRDFEFVRAGVTAERTAQVAQEVNRKSNATRTASGGSAPAKSGEEFVPTEQEAVFMRKPYNMSKEKILEARKSVSRV